MNKTFLVSIALLLLAATAFAFDDHVCDHDDNDYDTEEIDIEEDMSVLSEDRMLRSRKANKMRIVVNYDQLDNAPSSFRSYVKEIVPAVISYISNALPVKYPVVGDLSVSGSRVCDVRTPNDLKRGVNADLYIIFDSRSEDSSTVASSRACIDAKGTKRPIVTYTNFNRNMFKPAGNDILLHEKNMYLLIHEIMHTLGVSKNAYDKYIDENGNRRRGHMKTQKIGGVTQTVIDIPELTQKLRKFYGCSTIPGLIMENDGGSGTARSHVERKFFPYETMASGGMHGRRISEFSLALLEGSGWYQPDYSYAEPFFYGKGQGCDFINKRCSSSNPLFPEFCSGSNRGCGPQGRSGGNCKGDSKANGCRYVNPDPDYDCENTDGEDNARLPQLETYGRFSGAKCFTGNLNTRKSKGGSTSFCFKYSCVGSGSNTQVEVRLGKMKVTCDREGKQSVDGYYGTIDCPDPKTFCEGPGKKYCPRNCMGRGNCVNNKCECFNGFTGIDCGLDA